MSEIKLSFGDRLKLLRKRKNITLDQAQKEIGINRSQIGDYENNRRNPTANTAKKLSEYYGVSIDYLIYGDEKKGPEIREPDSPYGINYQECLEKLKQLDIEIQKDLIETFTAIINNKLEKREQKKKNSAISA